ncbi:hypothetical protein GA0070216_101415 [Micromonospora matsumotoense]|uniref:Helix-turn-helix domain-containing protein n=1 Tax=Micromonospora matsumotoense TaxID=121616 RepID=A0A1C4UD49_9ACTN|nr:hypothetical protein [Micromonospora matsumotoense]SCE69579.1 hypothetical protein GA0070216_101415 [Micromonospora matsumotoense]
MATLDFGLSRPRLARLPVTSANCPRCGGRLARDNDSGRCAPCQAAERDRLSAPPAVSASFWDHQPVRQALASRHLGQVIRAYRCHPYHGRHALPQTVVAGWMGITQAQLSRLENGPPVVHLDRLAHWAQVLRIPAGHLWFELPGSRRPSSRASAAGEPSRGGSETVTGNAAPVIADTGGDTTDRRRFNTLATLAGLGATGYLGLISTQSDAPRNIELEHVVFASSLVEELRRVDAAVGADALCDVAGQVHARMSLWAAKATYSRQVGHALQSALADLVVETAWLAIDADRRSEAKPYLNEAITRARLADDQQAEVRALSCLSMLLIRDDRPGESLHCSDAAFRSSAGWATPRLTTLLHLRAARAYASLQDASGFTREMAKAKHAFHRGTSDDDLPFLNFVTAQELNGIAGLSYLALNRPDRAAESFRAITMSPSPAFRRNQAYYTVQLADAMYRQGDVNGAAHHGQDALLAVSQMSSGRVNRLLAQVRKNVGRHRQASSETRQFVAAYDQAVRL